MDALLNSKNLSVIILSCIKVLNSSVPADLTAVYSKSKKREEMVDLFNCIFVCVFRG